MAMLLTPALSLAELCTRQEELELELFYNGDSSQAENSREYNRACLIEDALEETEAKIAAAQAIEPQTPKVAGMYRAELEKINALGNEEHA